ncbi:acyl-CoA transferases/carnitine dehydratase [Leptospira ryugenii]|uniref:Acyl-CoA transferases/carnitine dehydratase n=1 Tax=Leptospira ryugenii TaxID=1917863 RepID=A0A2P2E1V0_9LEPT|nr:CoA transferase [Leptospira ryugenii]GBF50867.1 acyl-CoA transferases/carnitine dehydratase [Leptospira ryugenii]
MSQTQKNTGPLSGVKVVDLSLLLPGPLCSQHLADMGAEVIKIENPRAYDASRAMFKGNGGYPALFMMLNRNKKAITLNLKRPASKEILFKLLEDADILLEGFRPDGMDKMGIGYDVLKEKFPKLIYCGISGYGISGKYVDFAGHDINYLAISGVLHQTGNPPRPAGFQLADVGGGSLSALSAILAALYYREKTGKGQRIDISMTDASLQFLSLYGGIHSASGITPEPGNEILSGKLPNYQIYQTKEGRYVALGALEDMFFQTFVRAIGKDELLKEMPLKEENLEKWKAILTEYFLSKTYSDLESIFSNEDACLSPILSLEEVTQDPHWKERKMVFDVEHPKYGRITQYGSPFHFSETPFSFRTFPPEHGEHTEEILKTIGYSDAEISQFKQEKVI